MDWMSSFAEKLAAAKQNRPTKDVQVTLDADVSAERERLAAEIDAADIAAAQDSRLGVDPAEGSRGLREELDALNERAKESLITIRFTRMAGSAWAELTSKNPVRLEVPIDRHYGYNYDAVCFAAAAATGVCIEGDEIEVLSPESWADLLEELSGHEVGLIRDAIWELNEFAPAQRVQELVKGSGVTTRSDKK